MKRTTVLALASLSAIGLVFIPSLIPAGPTSSLDASSLLASGRLFVAVGVIFLGGLLTSLTPCVYPLIPITVGLFGARQAESKGRALLLTTSYVVGMGIVFSALGVFAALSGRAFGSVLGNTYVILGLAVFMALLASSMFGAFELALPSGLATKLNGVGGGGIIGALLMGSVAGFLARERGAGRDLGDEGLEIVHGVSRTFERNRQRKQGVVPGRIVIMTPRALTAPP